MADDLAKFVRDVLNMAAALSDQRMKGVMTDLGDAAKGDMLEAVRADLGAMRGFNLTAGEESWRGSGACVCMGLDGEAALQFAVIRLSTSQF